MKFHVIVNRTSKHEEVRSRINARFQNILVLVTYHQMLLKQVTPNISETSCSYPLPMTPGGICHFLSFNTPYFFFLKQYNHSLHRKT